jgi:hypothetical protein
MGREQFQHLSPSSPLKPALSDLLSRMGSRLAAPTITSNVILLRSTAILPT